MSCVEKVADAAWAVLIVIVQEVLEPLHAPPQERKAKPASGVAVRVTSVPGSRVALQLEAGQSRTLIAPAVPPTLPPAPAETVRVCCTRLKVAVTEVAAVGAKLHTGSLPQVPAPLQPAKREPLEASAVRLTVPPLAKGALHTAPDSAEQLTPEGEDPTLPVPLPARANVTSTDPSPPAPSLAD